MLKDYNTVNIAGSSSFNTTPAGYYSGQTFVALSSYTITGIALKVARNGLPGNVTIGIWSTDPANDNKPLAELCTGVVDGNTWSTNWSDYTLFEWVTWNLGAGAALVKGTRYAIVVYDTAQYIYGCRTSASGYPFGEITWSVDSGSTWSYYALDRNIYDWAFKTYDGTTYSPQTVFVGGNVLGGKHLWKIGDDGETLSLEDSYVMPGNVTCLSYSEASNRLYAVVGTSIYCYDVNKLLSTINLVTSWGSSGSVDIGAAISDIDIDSSDYLVVAHGIIDSDKLFSLYDNTGTVVWRHANAFGAGTTASRVSFDVSGGINATTDSGIFGTIIAALLSRADGTISVTYETRTGSLQEALSLDSHGVNSGSCFYGRRSGTNTFIRSVNSTPAIVWTKSILSTTILDLAHISDLDFLVVLNESGLIGYYDVDGDTHPWADYSPTTVVNLFGNTAAALIENDNNEFYVTAAGKIFLCGIGFSARSELDLGATVLNAVAWTGTSNIAPVITLEPEDADLDVGAEASFIVAAEGLPEPTYQWYKDSGLMSGATEATLTFEVDEYSGGDYHCVATNVEGFDTSVIATLSIIPSITAQSLDTVSLLGQLVTLGVTAVGDTPLAYQWRMDGVDISGEMDAIYTFYSTINTPGTYTCYVKNDVGNVTSAPIVVTNISNPYRWNPFNIPLDSDREVE